jgi:ankyrin repeat protein
VGGMSLMWAAVYGNAEAVRLLLSRGADASLKDVDGVTAAEWAARNNRHNAVQVLKGKR